MAAVMKRLIISSLLLLVVGCGKNEGIGYSEQEMIYGLKTHGVRTIEKNEEGCVWLVSFPSTFDLDLDEATDTEVTDAVLVHRKGLTRLTHLNLDATGFTDAGLKQLKELTSLTDLRLSFSEITDTGLEFLKELTSLKYLSLSNTEITDAGLGHLRGLVNLESLDLIWTQTTDAGLEHLEGLTSLKSLSVGETRVTGARRAKLMHALRNYQLFK
jgi:hypothetical protein